MVLVNIVRFMMLVCAGGSGVILTCTRAECLVG
jgi:hypothetical protein